MANELAQLQVSLELQTAAFQAGVKQVDRRLKSMDRNVQKTSKSFKGMEIGLNKLKGGLAGIATAMATAFSAKAIKGTFDFADSLSLAAEKIGVTTDTLQVFQESAQRVGMSMQGAETALQRFSRRSAEAANGTGVLMKEYERLGIAVRDSAGNLKSTNTLLGEYADAVANVQDPAERLRLSVAAFDMEGGRLVNTLSQGSAGFAEIRKEMKETGQLIDNELIERTARLNRQWDDMMRRLSTNMKRMTLEAAEFWSQVFGYDLEVNELKKVENRIFKVQGLIDELNNAPTRRGSTVRAAEISELKVELQELIDRRQELKDLGYTLNSLTGKPEQASAGGSQVNELNKLSEALDKVKGRVKGIASIDAEWDRLIGPLEAQARAMNEAADPMLAYENGIKRLDEIMATGKLTAEGYAAAQKQLSDTLIEATTPATEALAQIQDTGTMMLDSFTDSFDAFANGVAAGTTKIKDLFKNMVQSLIAQFLKLMAYKGIMSLLGGPGTELGSAFGKASGLLQPSALGNVFANGRIQPFAKGGIIGGPTMFPLANGTGIAGEAGPEVIAPIRRGRNGEMGVGAVQPVVNINNNAPVGVMASSGADGSVDITIVERAVESAIRRGGNGIASAIESAYGVNRGAGAFGF